jgi:hypothetical protein
MGNPMQRLPRCLILLLAIYSQRTGRTRHVIAVSYTGPINLAL